jgi:hypothetical protein
MVTTRSRTPIWVVVVLYAVRGISRNRWQELQNWSVVTRMVKKKLLLAQHPGFGQSMYPDAIVVGWLT